MSDQITGTTASEIADSVRSLRDRGSLQPGSLLPPVRELAATLGVNRNTAVAAYRQLAQRPVSWSRAGVPAPWSRATKPWRRRVTPPTLSSGTSAPATRTHASSPIRHPH